MAAVTLAGTLVVTASEAPGSAHHLDLCLSSDIGMARLILPPGLDVPASSRTGAAVSGTGVKTRSDADGWAWQVASISVAPVQPPQLLVRSPDAVEAYGAVLSGETRTTDGSGRTTTSLALASADLRTAFFPMQFSCGAALPYSQAVSMV